MTCDIPLRLVNEGMLLQQLLPAAILLLIGIGLLLSRRISARKKWGATVLVTLAVMATSLSTMLLAVGSSIHVDNEAMHLRAGLYSTTVPLSGLSPDMPTFEPSLVRRTNGISSRGVNVGWFEDGAGRRYFAMHSGGPRVAFQATPDLWVVMDTPAYSRMTSCLANRP